MAVLFQASFGGFRLARKMSSRGCSPSLTKSPAQSLARLPSTAHRSRTLPDCEMGKRHRSDTAVDAATAVEPADDAARKVAKKQRKEEKKRKRLDKDAAAAEAGTTRTAVADQAGLNGAQGEQDAGDEVSRAPPRSAILRKAIHGLEELTELAPWLVDYHGRPCCPQSSQGGAQRGEEGGQSGGKQRRARTARWGRH